MSASKSEVERTAMVPTDADKAYDFLSNIQQSARGADAVDLKSLRRRIDWHLMPWFFLCYTMSFLDKVILNYGAVMGLNKDLKLTGNQFSNAGTLFFVVLLVAEFANGLVLNKAPPAKWFGISVALWGVATACTAAAKDYGTLLAARLFLALFEASMAPCLMLLISQWYTKSEQAPRFAIFYTGLGAGQIIGGLVSFAFQFVDNPSFSGWRIMFVVLGCVTAVIGLLTLWCIPDSPMAAKFLSDDEKAALLNHVSVNQTGIENHRFKVRQVVELLLDPQVWLLSIMTALLSVPSGVISLYSATLLKNAGFTSKISALLNVPSGVVSIISAIVSGWGIRYTSNRWLWCIGLTLPAILGGALMSFVPPNLKGGLLAGIYLINTVTAMLPVIYQWIAANVAGHTKRPFAMGFVSAGFALGNVVGPQTFRAQDAPDYTPARVTLLAVLVAGALVGVLVYLYYRIVNARRDRRDQTRFDDSGIDEKWGNLTDKENRSFRYVY
ncbi:hypothetical protein MBLNU457_6161t1 [Dothideomycetes sp. NU457]